jgi:RimJ/RimL family protein N-acetyltransferase
MDLRRTALSSQRLSLKAFEAGDAKEVFEQVTPTVTRFTAFDPSPSHEAFAVIWRTWLPKMEAGTDLWLVIRLESTGEFMGITGMQGVDSVEPEAGVWIKKSAHGFAYGREAVLTMMVWAARQCGAQAFVWPAVEENLPSRRLAESLNGVVVNASRLRKSVDVEYGVIVYRIPPPSVPA